MEVFKYGQYNDEFTEKLSELDTQTREFLAGLLIIYFEFEKKILEDEGEKAMPSLRVAREILSAEMNMLLVMHKMKCTIADIKAMSLHFRKTIMPVGIKTNETN